MGLKGCPLPKTKGLRGLNCSLRGAKRARHPLSATWSDFFRRREKHAHLVQVSRQILGRGSFLVLNRIWVSDAFSFTSAGLEI